MTVPTTVARTTGWTPDDSTFGARLAMVRQRMAWGNVKEAATACGLPAESWRTWERDNVEPRRIRAIAALIAERTGCDYGWLLDGPRLGGREHQPNVRKAPLADRPISPRPSGHPQHTTPVHTSRRPQRTSLALAHLGPKS